MLLESYYGDINLSNSTAKEIFLFLPRRELTTGKWMWLKRVVKVTRVCNTYGDVRMFLPAYKEIFYIEPQTYTMLLLLNARAR